MAKASSAGIEFALTLAFGNAIIPVDQRGVWDCCRGFSGRRRALESGFMVLLQVYFLRFLLFAWRVLSGTGPICSEPFHLSDAHSSHGANAAIGILYPLCLFPENLRPVNVQAGISNQVSFRRWIQGPMATLTE